MLKYNKIFLFLCLLNCGGPDDRQEVISKVRGIGLIPVPLVNTPSTASHTKTVDLKVYVAGVKHEAITFTSFQDQPTSSAYLLDSSQYEILSGTQSVESHNGLDLTTVTVRAQIPTADKLPPQGGKVRLGIRATGKTNQENLIGDFLVVPEGDSALLNLGSPTVEILSPSSSTVLKAGETFNVIASTNIQDENLKFGWFVSAGEITNRRAIDTYWKLPSAGSHTLIVTVRGKDSLALGIQILDLIVE